MITQDSVVLHLHHRNLFLLSYSSIKNNIISYLVSPSPSRSPRLSEIEFCVSPQLSNILKRNLFSFMIIVPCGLVYLINVIPFPFRWSGIGNSPLIMMISHNCTGLVHFYLERQTAVAACG